jgi:uncharacterized protein (TIGR03437 family)
MIRRIAFGLCLVAAPFLAHAQTSGTCTAATLNETYSLTLTGRTVTSTVAIAGVYEGVGTISFDGVSGVTATLTTNTNVTTGVSQTLSGTYTIPANCVGTLNFTTGDTASYTLIPYNKGNNFFIIGQDATYQLTGSGGPQPDAGCLTSTLSGVYAFSGNGFALSIGAVSGVNYVSGLLQFDGAGTISGSWSTSTNGAATPDTVSGQYAVTAACTGTATVKDPSGVAYTLSFVVTTADGANVAIVGATPTDIFTSTMHSTFTNPGLAVANAAGVSGGTPPGSLFSIYGFNLASGQAQGAPPYPITLATASVTVNGEPAPLTYVNPTQINAQMPWDITPGVATVVVTTGTTVSNAVAATVPATAVPGVFVYGSNEAVAENFPSYVVNSPSAPAPVGSTIVVFLTGGGPVQGGNSLVTGHATPNAVFPVTEPYSATIAGVNAPVSFIGLTPGNVGLYQANVTIPQVGKGNHNLSITIGGTASAATVISTN